jgi:hypothetical protein
MIETAGPSENGIYLRYICRVESMEILKRLNWLRFRHSMCIVNTAIHLRYNESRGRVDRLSSRYICKGCNLHILNTVTGAVYPLGVEDRRYFHPSSRAQWDRVPGRPTAWRLHPYSYMWIPSSELFPAVGHSHTGSFPREFSLLVTLRLRPHVRLHTTFLNGTIKLRWTF